MRKYLRRRKLPALSAAALPASQPTTGRGNTPSKPSSIGFPEAKLPTRWKRAFADVTVATILDDFSAQAFGYEWNQIPLTRHSWREQLNAHQPDLLFVESAWHGNEDQWQSQLTSASGVGEALRSLVTECKRRGLPTVFWNKEDPPHYQDFLECAALFDHVFTSDLNMVGRYCKDLGHDRVGVLAFAAQPAIHSPARPASGFHARDVAFAGMYFAHKFPERREQMDILLGGAADVSPKMQHGLEIFSRQLGGDDRYQFPAPWDRMVVGSLNYRQMLTAYQAYKVFLNVNSVVDSPSMCARRVFEILSSGTPVVSTPSAAVGEYFPPDELPVVTDRQAAGYVIQTLVRSPEYSDRMVRKAQRRIWNQHTHTHRAAEVLTAALGQPPDGSVWIPRQPTISTILCTNRPQNIPSAVQTIGSQVGVDLELVIVCHGCEPEEQSLRRMAETYGLTKVQVIHAPAEWTLGECLNAGVAASHGDVITKMDDDDWYGPNYLQDQLSVMRVTGADIVGKLASYMYVEYADLTLLRFPEQEHRWTDFVLGPTIMANKSVFFKIPFESRTTGEDSSFLRSASDAGYKIYASDRFNFRQFRGQRGHTWQVESQQILSTGVVVTMGDLLRHIEL